MTPEEHGLRPSSVSKGARKVADSLNQAGFSAELVGGCVRDLLLGERPKDFDVVTDASPEDVRRVFPRSRMIGRRFRIVHVRMGREVIEVSTYRAGIDSESEAEESTHSHLGRILRDNVFGTREQDVFRRDFTANALYYDIGSNSLLDYVDGFSDIKSGRLRFIGDPAKRINEDPVRMLRAVRFKAKLDLDLEPGIDEIFREQAYLLRHVPPARLFDEVLKLFHSGYAVASFGLLREFGLFAELFPEAERSYGEADLEPQRGLVLQGFQNTDRRIEKGKPVIAAFLFACIFWRAVRRQCDRHEGRRKNTQQLLQRSAFEVLGRENQRVMIPRRVSTAVVEIWELQSRLEARRPRMVQRLLENRRFRAAYDFLLLRSRAGEVPSELAGWWTEIQECDGPDRQAMIQGLGGGRAPRKGRRRPRRSRPPAGNAR
ncbi:MAG: polynucleotide adenylyltransferase PcnB [Arenicellales bacterium]|nr:polynucleotide adenylyltransferase PcnB [Arenicellales bacterium]MDP6791858.1 polynucleotide adenylyltransferase PcnB [Arenicellales bacterium]MDP6918310.1 polynucleotide adenylyltransferase PcnB [Arenicellales bacterium]